MEIGVNISNNDGSLPPPPSRPLHLGEEHAAVTAFRDANKENYRLLVRLVDSGHMDDKTMQLLADIKAKAEELHAHLDAVDAAWLEANLPAPPAPAQ